MGDKVAFLYAPVGWQRPDMGRRLYEREAVFREALDAAAADLGAAAPDLLAALYPKAKGVYDGVLDGVRYALAFREGERVDGIPVQHPLAYNKLCSGVVHGAYDWPVTIQLDTSLLWHIEGVPLSSMDVVIGISDAAT